MTEALAPRTPPRSAPADNGILARVPGQVIAKASKSLPDPACAPDDEIRVEIDIAAAGRVRLTFRKQRYSRPRGNISYVSWLCRHAEAVTPACAPAAPHVSTTSDQSIQIRRVRGLC